MSRFEELSHSFLKSRAELTDYKADCQAFATDLFDRLVEYLDVPPSHFQLITLDPDGIYQPVIPMSKAMVLVENGFWYFGIALAFGHASEMYKHELTVLHLFVKKEGDQYQARLGTEGEAKGILRDDPASWQGFFDFLYQETLTGFHQEMESFLQSRQENNRKIGFFPRLG